MPRDSSGVYGLPTGNPVVFGNDIDPGWANTTLTDIGQELTNSLDKGGRTVLAANLQMGGFLLTGLGAGAAAGQSLRYEQVSLRVAEATIALTAAATDPGAQLGGYVLLTGGGLTVTAFATAAAGTMKVVSFDGVNTLTHSANLFLPNGGSNISTVGGDQALIRATATGWIFVSYVRASGQPLQALGTPLSGLTAGIAASTINSAAFQQTWQWTYGASTTTTSGLLLSETAAATGTVGTRTLLQITTATTSTTHPFAVVWNGFASPGYFGYVAAGTVGVGAIGSLYLYATTGQGSLGTGGGVYLKAATGSTATNATGGDVSITSGDSIGTGDAGTVLVTGGTAAGTGKGGNLQLAGGNAGTAAKKGVVLVTNLLLTGTVPTITGGAGAGATISGSDNAFYITVGTAPGTSITVDFSRGYNVASVPIVVAQVNRHGLTIFATATSSTITISLSSAPTAGDIISVICFPRAP